MAALSRCRSRAGFAPVRRAVDSDCAAVLRNEEGVFSVRETVTYEIDRAIRRNALIWEENGD